jgi:hypothetical protein
MSRSNNLASATVKTQIDVAASYRVLDSQQEPHPLDSVAARLM